MTELVSDSKSSCDACTGGQQNSGQSEQQSESVLKELQFAVNMTCQSCADAVQRALSSRPAGEIVDARVSLREQRVQLRTGLHVDAVLELLESTGLRAVLQGVGTASCGMSGQDFAAGVAQIESPPGSGGPRGVVRILQPDDVACVFDGTVDGLEPGQRYRVEVRQSGDMSRGLEHCGPVYCEEEDDGEPLDPATAAEPSGYVGSVLASDIGRIRFGLTSSRLRLWRLIGRGLSISDADTGAVRGFGVVARSAGLFANDKRLCTCDGVEIWSERDVPAAGAARASAAALKQQQQQL